MRPDHPQVGDLFPLASRALVWCPVYKVNACVPSKNSKKVKSTGGLNNMGTTPFPPGRTDQGWDWRGDKHCSVSHHSHLALMSCRWQMLKQFFSDQGENSINNQSGWNCFCFALNLKNHVEKRRERLPRPCLILKWKQSWRCLVLLLSSLFDIPSHGRFSSGACLIVWIWSCCEWHSSARCLLMVGVNFA